MCGLTSDALFGGARPPLSPPSSQSYSFPLLRGEGKKNRTNIFRCYLFLFISILEMVGTTGVVWRERVREGGEVTAALSGNDTFLAGAARWRVSCPCWVAFCTRPSVC